MRGRAFVLAAGLSLIAVLPMQASTATPKSAAPAPNSAPVNPNSHATSWIVTLEPNSSLALAPGLAKQAGGEVGHTYSHALHGFEFKGSAQAANSLQHNPNVRTVQVNAPVHLASETVPPGIERIRADHPTQPDAHDQGFTGAGARIAILDTGIDLTHPDLVANIDAGLGKNCVTAGPPQDGHGHGTHVAGIVAAVEGNNIGVVGVAPSARLVPVKVVDDQGNGDWAEVICGIDYVTGLNMDTDSTNDVDVVNMSLGDSGSIGDCSDGGLREAICNSVAAGITYVAAAGNSSVDTSTFIPAAFPEVIAVSAMADLDGEPGGAGGCQFFIDLFANVCDDTFAFFSNYGPRIDVTAPGVEVYSTWTGGGYATESGTSMASPHVAGVAALMKAANKSLTPAQVKQLLKLSGENPNGTTVDPTGCSSSTGTWSGDPDGIGEPLVNALRAAQMAQTGGPTGQPSTAVTSPADGASVSGTTTVTASATGPNQITSVQFSVDGRPLSTDTTVPYTADWDTTLTIDGVHTLSVRATDSTGAFACASSHAQVGPTARATGMATTAWTATRLVRWYSDGRLTCRDAQMRRSHWSRAADGQWSTTRPTSARTAGRQDGHDPPRDHLVRRQPASSYASTSRPPTAARSACTRSTGRARRAART